MRKRWQAITRLFGSEANEEEEDLVASAPASLGAEPEARSERATLGARLERAIAALPLRQQQAFLLRAWEGLDVTGTAFAMSCSEGSVKTHYFRAVHALRAELGDLTE